MKKVCFLFFAKIGLHVVQENEDTWDTIAMNNDEVVESTLFCINCSKKQN